MEGRGCAARPVPVPTRDGAPPLGLSVVGPRGTDEALLRLACELEKALME